MQNTVTALNETIQYIQLAIPLQHEGRTVGSITKLPAEFATFTPEENYIALSIGIHSVLTAKQQILLNNHSTIHEKIRAEVATRISELEILLATEQQKLDAYRLSEKERIATDVQRQTAHFEQFRKTYDQEFAHLNDLLAKKDAEIQACRTAQAEMHMRLDTQFREKYEASQRQAAQLLQEKERSLQQNITQLHEMMRSMVSSAGGGVGGGGGSEVSGAVGAASTKAQGTRGEIQYRELAERTFRDIDHFEITDVHTVGGRGDFHMKFSTFNVLVDAKMYTNKVPSSQREKIKKDLKNNSQFDFAWLVSLNTSIERYDKSLFMFEWIEGNKCVVYINNLNAQENPQEVLRLVWFTCKELYDVAMRDDSSQDELRQYKEKHRKAGEKYVVLRKQIRDLNARIAELRSISDAMDMHLCELISSDTGDAVADSALIAEWWGRAVTRVTIDTGNGGENAQQTPEMTSTELWQKFKKDCGAKMSGGMDVNKFKTVLCTFLPSAEWTRGGNGKTKGGVVIVRGFQWKV